MRILFFGRRFTYFRNFDSVLRELASRGHTIHLAVDRDPLGGDVQPRGADGNGRLGIEHSTSRAQNLE